MAQYFNVVIRYDKLLDGSPKRVGEHCLVDALTCVEAVERVTAEKKPYISGDFIATSVRQTSISEVVGDKECGKFYLVKVAFITIDEKTAAEKRSVSQILVGAESFKEAYDAFTESMKDTLADYEVVSVAETPIIDYYPVKL